MVMTVTELIQKLLPGSGRGLHHRVVTLEKSVRQLEDKCRERELPDYWLRVDTIHIDKVIVERFDLSNNFANLGIKDLGGTMNIGAVYAAPPPDSGPKDQKDKNRDVRPEGDGPARAGPRVTISYGR